MAAPTRLLLAAPLLLAGCTLDLKKLDPHIPGDADAFCGQAMALLVERAASCLATTADFQRLDQVYLPCQAWTHEIGLGHASYDRFAAADCIAAVGSSPCEQLFSPNGGVPDICRMVVNGSLNAGDACTADAACATGLCQVGTTCPGTCADFLAMSATGCSTTPKVGPQCQKGLFCHVAPGPTATCLPILYVNDLCNATPEGCEPGATCDSATGRCAPQRPAGGSCASQADCQPGLLCALAQLSPAVLQCTPPLGPGQACTVGKRACATGTYCRSANMTPGDAGSCTPYSGVGGGCDLAAAEPRGCLGGWCDMSLASPACVDFVPETVACTADPQCGPGGICTPGVDVCFKACFP